MGEILTYMTIGIVALVAVWIWFEVQKETKAAGRKKG
jgi:hypothetical protein